ncbi:MAG: hypothetical protein K1X75_11525 [Leptospirales bacterium]|nr:hypothetical protein [Leptospirales bacterium]
MDQRHQDYIDYYKARMKKYEGNPLYPHSYAAEKAIYEALASCKELAEFKSKLEAGKLNLKVALALVKDQETAEKKHWEELKEPIRAAGCQRILDVIDSFDDVMQMIDATNLLRQETSKLISVDGFADYFYSDFIGIENIEEDEKGEVPARWRKERDEAVRHAYEEAHKLFREVTLPRAREWKPDWQMDHDLVWEDRHRRLIPIPDESVKRRIPEHKKYLGI